jgi:hypothetical protein
LTERKYQSSTKVLVDPSLQHPPPAGESIEMSWFKK